MASSAVGEKVRERVISPNGRIRPPELSIASLSLMVSQSTEQNMVCRVLLCISLKEKLSARSSMVE
jgi:hypothetical protein